MPRTNLDAITDFPGLLNYLEEELDWPINEATFEEATFDFTPAELGLKADAVGGPIEIKQLRRLTDNQPWGVFFLNLPQKRLPQTIVRNILGRLTVKKRQASNDPSRPAFLKSDLLFITSTGAGADRRLAFAHFQDDPLGGNAVTLKILGWDGDDTPRRLELTRGTLAEKLHWPDNPADTEHWRAQWSAAFTRADTRTVVRDSKVMAKALAALARRIRSRAAELMDAQTADGSLVKLHAAFKEALIHDLTPAGFADTYAQTVAYGLLSTRISRASGALTQDDVTANVAGTSPFLKEMLGQFIEAGGKKAGKAGASLDFDELGVGEVVDLLRDADMAAVLADFDRRNPDEDPVIHFYELFLKEYDAVQKVKRGVFYTPRPVVGFIVRSVDDVLRTEFHLTDGLASTATWGEVIAASAARGDARPITLPAGAALSDPFVRILDPATGTGTFLVECVDLIHKTMLARWQTEKRSKAEIRALWNTYVPEHLLPRLAGFELMMAPYAIAHVKLGLKLSDTGYTFGSDARAQIYLTNALEPAQDLDMQLAFMSEALAHEAKAANEAKKTRFTVVVGNPPYKGESANPSKDGKGRLTAAGRLIRHYFTVDGKPLGEANSKWVNNDYIKFLALAEKIVTESGLGILGYITSHSWLLGGPFRGVRASHTETYQKLWIVDCHGNIGRRERAADGSRDVGIFEIEEGTNITVGAKIDQPTQTYFQDLFGSLETKFAWCNHAKIHLDVAGRIFPKSDMYALQPPDNKISSVDESFPKVNVVFPQNSVGILTSQDELSIHFSKSELKSAMDAFVSLDLAAVQNERSKKTEPADWKIVLVDGAASLVEKSEARDWRVDWAQSDIRSHKAKLPIKQLLYRPFDVRWTVYTGKSRGFHCMPRPENMANMFLSNPLGLVSARSNKTGMADHFFVSTLITEAKVGESGTQSNLFPLWVRPQGSETHTLPNIAPNFTNRVAALTGLAWDDCVERPKQGALAGVIASMPTQTAMFANRPGRGEPGHSFGPRDLFDWIYAVLHSPAYRRRYADYLKSDFARVPLPGSAALFEALVPIGTDLVATHLLDAEHRFGPDRLPILADPKGIRLAGSGEARVTQFPTFQAGRVYISGTRWFEIIPEVAWNFHIGGYQPAQKWLKDRAAKGGKKASTGRVLTDEDILHYRRIIMALTRTVELVPKIDKIIEEHGGWPGAFRGMADEVAIKAEAAD